MESSDFLFTWKPEKWPYEKLRALIEAFEAGQTVVEPWRYQAHRQVQPGSRAYLYKQGAQPRGIFAVAEVVGPSEERAEAEPGEGRHVVPLRFDLLLDPTRRLLLSEEELLRLPAPDHRWATQASGVRLEPQVARLIDAVAAREFKTSPVAATPDARLASAEKRERLAEVYERDQVLVEELRGLYAGQCQICASEPFNGQFGKIAEAHHIQWLCRGGPDNLDNMVLLCPNHHAAIHAWDPEFDRARLEFRFGGKILPIRLDRHLRRGPASGQG